MLRPIELDRDRLEPPHNNLRTVIELDSTIDWPNEQILDLGCNQGNLVYYIKDLIDPDQYQGLDLNRSAVNQARIKYPNFRFTHYDRYHPSYNPTGQRSQSIQDAVRTLGTKKLPSLIFAYSVFTHQTLMSSKKLLEELLGMLDPNRGRILFTAWIDLKFDQFMPAMSLRHRVPMLTMNNNTWSKVCYLIDYQYLVYDRLDLDEVDSMGSLCTFFRPQTILDFDQGIEYLGTVSEPNRRQWLYRLSKPQ